MCIHSSKLELDCTFTDLIPYTSISINPNPGVQETNAF